MIRSILEKYENNPSAVFRKSDFQEDQQKDQFDELRQSGLLEFIQPDPYYQTYPCKYSCSKSCPMEVIKFKDNLYAICPKDSEKDPILVDKNYLHKYRFVIKGFLEKLKLENDISGDGSSGELQELSKDCYYLGSKQYGAEKIGFVFLRNADSIRLIGIQIICNEKNLVVLTAVKKLDKVDLVGRNIINFSLAESLKDFRLDIDLSSLNIIDDGLTEQQRLDYEKYKYLCYDKISIPDQEPKNRTYTAYVNEKQVHLGESLYRLLIRFAVELKKGNGGWVNVYTLYEERIISDPEKYHIYSDLRSKLEGCLLKGNAKDLIESDGSKNYRLSVHPDFCNV